MPQGGAVVDAVIWRQIDFGRTAQLDRVEASDYVDGDRPMAERVTVDFASGEVHRRVLTDRAVEFGDVREEGAPHRYAYLAAGCHGHPNEWGPAMAVMKLEAGGIGPLAADAHRNEGRHIDVAHHLRAPAPIESCDRGTPCAKCIPEEVRFR